MRRREIAVGRRVRRRVAGATLVLLGLVAGPVAGQGSAGRWGVLRPSIDVGLRSQLHRYGRGTAVGVRLGVLEGDRWQAGIAGYRFRTDLEEAAEVASLSPENALVMGERYRDISMYGLDGSVVVLGTRRYGIGVGAFVGVASYERVREWYEFFAYDSEGAPLNTAVIATGREVTGVAEPSLRLRIGLTRRLHLSAEAGYLFAASPLSGATSLSSPGVGLGIRYALR